MENSHLSERHACELNGINRSSYCYEPEPDCDAELRTKLTELARQKPRYGPHEAVVREDYPIMLQFAA